MKRIPLCSVLGIVAAIALLQPAPAQGPEGPGGKGKWGAPGGAPPFGRRGFDPHRMMELRTVESYWMAMSFEVKVSDSKLTRLRPKFQQAWNARKKAFEESREKHDPETLITKLKEVNSTLENAMREVLGEKEFQKVRDAAEWRGMRSPGPPPGPFSGPPPGSWGKSDRRKKG